MAATLLLYYRGKIANRGRIDNGHGKWFLKNCISFLWSEEIIAIRYNLVSFLHNFISFLLIFFKNMIWTFHNSQPNQLITSNFVKFLSLFLQYSVLLMYKVLFIVFLFVLQMNLMTACLKAEIYRSKIKFKNAN